MSTVKDTCDYVLTGLCSHKGRKIPSFIDLYGTPNSTVILTLNFRLDSVNDQLEEISISHVTLFVSSKSCLGPVFFMCLTILYTENVILGIIFSKIK